jgi:hypothetical protein
MSVTLDNTSVAGMDFILLQNVGESLKNIEEILRIGDFLIEMCSKF